MSSSEFPSDKLARQLLASIDELRLTEPSPAASEVVVTSPSGGRKASKQAQLGAIDPSALLELAKVAGYGGQKYERLNYVRGYAWSLSYDACQRHLLAFWSGEAFDPESRLPHLAHAAWHCLCLLTFSTRRRGTDDRIGGML